jgi:hypothetical protein
MSRAKYGTPFVLPVAAERGGHIIAATTQAWPLSKIAAKRKKIEDRERESR